MKSLVIGEGNVFADLVIVGEAPGSQENEEGRPFIGRSGKLLRNLLLQSGINLSEDIYFCNVLKCRPTNNRKPTIEEIKKHKPWVLQQIQLVNPKIVILTGATAMYAILGIKKPISSIRGKWIVKDGIEYKTIFHPSYLLRFSQREINNPYGLTLKDLQNVRNRLYNL